MPTGIQRLKRRVEFLRVADARLKWATEGLVLQARPRAGSPGDDPAAPSLPARVGFTVTKKVGNAVERNRVRRRLRAACDAVLPRIGRPAFDYVVIGRRATLSRRYEALLDDVERAVEGVHRLATGRRSGRRS